ncbi:unnamed protein product [Pedinophyceae sp. YPF-701]|nr:unnamed protein product [Pedinophyceae sp. YPF-701]
MSSQQMQAVNADAGTADANATTQYADGGPVYYGVPATQVFSVDVECVATGITHNDRAIGQISLVDQNEYVRLNLYVKQDRPVTSYLTELTGLTRKVIETYGISLEEALAQLRQELPKDAVLVGWGIMQDVKWLGLKEGQDFKSMMDLQGLYRVWNPQYGSYTLFSQDHAAQHLLGWPGNQAHDAVGDAVKSIRLYNCYKYFESNPDEWEAAQAVLLQREPHPSFAKQHPTYEGVCMGNRKTCKCGAPFFT